MTATEGFYDALETRDAETREAALMAALPEQVALAQRRAPAYGAALGDVEPADVTSRAALARLPVTRKSDLPNRQSAAPPFGGYTSVAPGELHRIFASPGPIYDPEGKGPGGRDYWRSARALFATGLRPGDVLHNCFSYHFTPAGVMFETGAHAIGCAVVPAGVGNTELQARAIADIRPQAYVGTPDFLQVILEKADALDLDCGSVRLAHVSGGPFLPPQKVFYESRDIAVFQSYGTADLGLIAYESPSREGLIVDEGVIVEIVRPGTGDPVADGEVGEVVVTSFSREYPLLRFATGDLSAVLAGPSPCGRSNMRIKGWLGRADQTTKIKGMFVHPEQIAEVLKRHPEAGKARLVVDNPGDGDTMVLSVEAGSDESGLATAMADTLQSVTKLRGTVEIVSPGGLPNDGKVIDDIRRYD